MLSNFLIVAAVAVLSMALRSYRHRNVRRIGTLGIFVTSFLAGWLIGGHLLWGVAFAASWILLPWVEILTRVRKLRLPIDRQLSPRTPPNRSDFPNFNDLTDEVEAEHFEHVDDIGWDHDEQRQFYRVHYQAESRTETAICLVEQSELAFYYVSITSRGEDGHIYTTWNYPFSYGLRLLPRLRLHRTAGDIPFSEMLSEHRLFLDRSKVGVDAVRVQTPDQLRQRLESDLHDQILHNLDRGLLVRDGEKNIRYSARGMLFLWVQFLRDLVRLS